MLIVYSIIAFLVAITGLCLATTQWAMNVWAVALAFTSSAVVMSIVLTVYSV